MSDNVDYVRPDVEYSQTDWFVVNDVVAGERVLKDKGHEYLPMLNPEDTSDQNITRNAQYVKRAYFFNATGRTLEGLIGIAFRQPPDVEVPDAMESVKSDVDGAGGNIVNQSHRVLESVLKTGRHGLLVDYPSNEQSVSVSDQSNNNIHATILTYQPGQIINWKIGDDRKPSLVVLYELVTESNDFSDTIVEQWRELRMVEGNYTVTIWRRKKKNGVLEVYDTYQPTNGSGDYWAWIPFYFIGAIDNDADIDKGPLLDLATANLAHYRNSADFQDAAFFSGQPQIWVTGADEHWMNEVQKSGVYFGSRAIGSAPQGGGVTMLQAAPNMASRESMQDIAKDMISLGARLLSNGEAAKTAEQSRSETAANHSVLSLAVTNVSNAYTRALQDAALYMRIEGDIEYVINTDFVGVTVDPQRLAALIAAWQNGSVPNSDHWANMRSIGVIDAYKTDEEIEGEIESSGSGLNLGDAEV